MVALMTESVFIIAEAGVNHNGDPDMALALVDAAAEAGADAVKFQTFSADRLTTRTAAKAEYQSKSSGEGSQYDMLKALEMSVETHRRVLERCKLRGIEFMSTAFDEESFDFLVDLGIRRVKIPSGEITNIPYLQHVAKAELPLILSTGMASLEEVRQATVCIREAATAAPDMTVLHCTSNYPALPEDVNLRAMQTMAHELGVPVGYSDHTLGIFISVSAVAMGAVVIEKHFTLDKSLPGPDHKASLEPWELKAMVEAIRDVEVAFGNGVKEPRARELPVRDVARRSVATAREVVAGQPISLGDLQLLRPGTGIAPKDMNGLVGRTFARDLPVGHTLDWTDIA